MSIPTVPVSVKFPPDEVAQIKGLAEARGFESVSEYMRHLVSMDKELLRKQYLALQPIFAAGGSDSKGNDV